LAGYEARVKAKNSRLKKGKIIVKGDGLFLIDCLIRLNKINLTAVRRLKKRG
jgi:hypothetical protein